MRKKILFCKLLQVTRTYFCAGLRMEDDDDDDDDDETFIKVSKL